MGLDPIICKICKKEALVNTQVRYNIVMRKQKILYYYRGV